MHLLRIPHRPRASSPLTLSPCRPRSVWRRCPRRSASKRRGPSSPRGCPRLTTSPPPMLRTRGIPPPSPTVPTPTPPPAAPPPPPPPPSPSPPPPRPHPT